VRTGRGGILLDFFFILLIISGGAAAWLSRDRWWPIVAHRLPWETAAARGRPSLWNGAAAAPGGQDSSTALHRGASFQAAVRDLLAQSGVGDRNVLKTYTEERGGDGDRWVESTLEIAPDGEFHTGRFLERLAPALHRSGLSVLRDDSEGERWVLELGDRDRVFQRLVFQTARGPRVRSKGV